MNNHQFIARLPLPVTVALLTLLIAPTLTGILLGHQQEARQMTELTQQRQKLQEHRRVADAIVARQQSFARQPARQLDPQQLTALTLVGDAWRDDIALMSLEMDARQERVRLEVVASSLDAVLDFVSRLQNSQTRVGLEHHQSENNLPGPWKIRATLNLEYFHAS